MPDKPVSIGRLAAEVGFSQNWLRSLAETGQIPSTRTVGGHRRFDVDAVRAALRQRENRRGTAGELTPATVEPAREPDWQRSLSLQGLDEHDVWMALRGDLDLDATSKGGRIFIHAFNEMLNNAIDHSSGDTVNVEVWSDSERLAVRIRDDGVGAFAHLREVRGLADDKEAVAELTKGKVTTMPERHSGEGIFFTSKAADIFQLTAGRLRWTVDNLRGDQALGQVPATTGTTVFVQIAPDTTRILREVFAAFTDEGEFNRTRPSVKLLSLGTTFVSRSEARRILEGMDAFTEIEIDFHGVTDVGQGFVDEVFRVWPAQHLGSRTIPVNMNEAVEFMVQRGLPKPRSPRSPGL
jgi:anti-sigma regulatory factor (Ser/Thr protein kinase)